MAGCACNQMFRPAGFQPRSAPNGESKEVDHGTGAAWMGWTQDERQPVVSADPLNASAGYDPALLVRGR